MEIILDEKITPYCLGNTDERTGALNQIDTAQTRPVRILPIFEVCRALHFGAVQGAIQPGSFRTCWSNLANELSVRLDYGHLIHVAYGESEAGQLVSDVLNIGQVKLKYEQVDGDPRSRSKEHRALTERFRRLHDLELRYLEQMDESYRGWACEPLDQLPDIEIFRAASPHKIADEQNLVLDTNNLIELLNSLPLDGLWKGRLRLPERLSERAGRCFRRILSQKGFAGKLIVPISALEEAERVINYPQNQQKYKHARLVLRKMALSSVWPLHTAFHFEPLSHEILAAFVALYEQLGARHVPTTQWPDFGDALILAHGIANLSPIASNEWFEKADWAAVGSIFDYLVLRDEAPPA